MQGFYQNDLIWLKLNVSNISILYFVYTFFLNIIYYYYFELENGTIFVNIFVLELISH